MPGSCYGPSSGHGSGGPSTRAVTAPGTAAPGALVDVTLSHASPFTGFLLKANGGAQIASAYPSGTRAMSCGGGFSFAAGHNSAAAQTSVTFSVRMPCSPGSVTFTGFLLHSYSDWKPVDSATITVNGADCPTCAGFDCSSNINDLVASPEVTFCNAGCTASECCTVVPPAPPSSAPPAPPANSISKQLAPDVQMSWTVDGDAVAIDVVFDGNGWVSFGRAETAGAMIGGQVLIGQPGSGVAEYSMSTKLLSGVAPTGATVPPGTNIAQADGKTVLTVPSWPAGSGAQELLWAVGSSNALSVAGHEMNLRGGMSIDFQTGNSETSINQDKRIALIIHGGLMLLGWGVLLPMGIYSSIFRSQVASGANGIWLKYHARLQVTGVVLGFVALIIPWWVMDAGTPLSSPNRPMIHTTVGLVLTIYSAGQLLLGKLRPPATKDGEEPTAKRRMWEKLHKYSGRIAMLVALWQLASGCWLSSDFIGSESGRETVVWLLCLGGVLFLNIGMVVRASRGRQQKPVLQGP